MTASPYALEIVNLKKAFGGLPVTQDVSLAIRPGERRLIIGPNGAGKTTLFNQVTGDLKPNSGTDKTCSAPTSRNWRPTSARIPDCRGPTRSSRCSPAIRWSTTSRSACSACGRRAGRCGGRCPTTASLRPKRGGRSTASGCCISPRIRYPTSPMAKSAASNWRWRWRKSRACCCWTSRWRDFRTPNARR